MLFILSMALLISTLKTISLRHENNFLAADREFLKKNYDYYFDGAVKRQYLDICKNAKGEIGSWFKDECVK